MGQHVKENYKHSDITDKIIRAAFDVYNKLGLGFVEKVYENALALEVRKLGLKVEQQVPVKVYYDGSVVGDYVADLVVDGKVIVEIKAVSQPVKAHEVQLVNYLKATEIEVGLLINFGKDIVIKRKIFDQ